MFIFIIRIAPNRRYQALISLSPHNKNSHFGKKPVVVNRHILQLLIRNYDVTQGQILLAGEPIAAYSEPTLRSQLILLTQRVHIS